MPSTFNLSSNEGRSEDPRLAFDGQGTLHLTWSDKSLRREGDIFYRHLTSAGEWSDAESLTADTAGFFDRDVQLLRNPAGQVCIIWRVVSGSNEIVMRCHEHDTWLPRVMLGNAGGSYSYAFDADGKIKSVANDRGSGDVYFEDHKLSAGPSSSMLPAFAIDAAGGYHVAWLYAGQPYRLEYRYSKDHGQTWTDIERLTIDANSPDHFSLVADSVGNVHLAWHGFNGGLFHMAQGSDGTWGTPRTISETGSSARVAMDPSGKVHIAWAHDGDIFYASLP